ncbi:hypothetical protein SAMN04487770_13628 [Butyrivibrio sp. ob235]|uniref:hypothetical protein n=1 Tax=Butyrivibrio sp. ob235 TaxID=1761780 RepID=UPI0008AAF00C|nr:hypothetical protein [Butyrivibrio sp. ob235]SEM38666.1 hypothetical protein SAMN04487770_13628 [Butyrivibrio sp. ob235]
MNKETAQTLRVACCTYDGVPMHEGYVTDGWMRCPECGRLYRVIINDEKVVVIEDKKLVGRHRAILRWKTN